ncbi:MAG: hypothetical protein PHE11_07865 [Candidatus Omnitrophica bacterium]|jgi:hypothetical protein|nr:hypothetical protein [Candidatus Omnitrophota bacterium]
MGDEICVGRKEIIAFFKELKLVGKDTSVKDAWVTIYRWKRKYGIFDLFHRRPNGKPMVVKAEIRLWVEKTQKLNRLAERREREKHQNI